MTHNLVDTLREAIHERRRRVVVIGDTMVDRWVHGRVAPCQDYCDKFVVHSVVDTPGGAANAERCLSFWDINTSLTGFTIGAPVKTRYVSADGKIIWRVDEDGDADARSSKHEWARRQALEMLPHAGAVLLSDYDKGFLTYQFIRDVVASCRTFGIPCVADCKREPELYAGCILKGNHNYTVEKCYRCDVVTRGANPPIVNHEGIYPPAAMQPVRCINHVGAGDCFAAHLALALAYGFTLRDAAALAHSAGRVYVQHPHNRPPRPSEIAADMALTGVTA